MLNEHLTTSLQCWDVPSYAILLCVMTHIACMPSLNTPACRLFCIHENFRMCVGHIWCLCCMHVTHEHSVAVTVCCLDSLVHTVKHLMVSFNGFLVYLPLCRHNPAPLNGKPECIGSCRKCDVNSRSVRAAYNVIMPWVVPNYVL